MRKYNKFKLNKKGYIPGSCILIKSTREAMVPRSSRRSFTKEFKLQAIRFYDNGNNINQTANKFKVAYGK